MSISENHNYKNTIRSIFEIILVLLLLTIITTVARYLLEEGFLIFKNPSRDDEKQEAMHMNPQGFHLDGREWVEEAAPKYVGTERCPKCCSDHSSFPEPNTAQIKKQDSHDQVSSLTRGQATYLPTAKPTEPKMDPYVLLNLLSAMHESRGAWSVQSVPYEFTLDDLEEENYQLKRDVEELQEEVSRLKRELDDYLDK